MNIIYSSHLLDLHNVKKPYTLARCLLWTHAHLLLQMSTLFNRHSLSSAMIYRLAVSTAAQPSPVAFARSIYSRDLLLSLTPKKLLLPLMCAADFAL